MFSVLANGKNKVQLTQKRGTNDADFSADFTYFINSYTSATTPYEFTLHKARNGKKIRDIKDNKALLEKLKPYNFSKKEFSTIEVNGNKLNMWMIKPSDFDPNKKYPLLMYQYSGPGSQEVSNTFFGPNDYWYQLLAQQGYIIACVDGRGTGFKGADFKKVTQKELGKFEVEDQIEAARIDGATRYQQVRYIIIPHLFPLINAITDPFFTFEPSFFFIMNLILLSISAKACLANNKPPITAF